MLIYKYVHTLLEPDPPMPLHVLTTNLLSQFETVLIQRIYTHFKKAPPTHKLGVLYVVDSVTRGWVEQARKAGQAVGPSEHPTDGTFAAGHKRVTELLPSFMNDIINTAPEDQKVRLLECSYAAIVQLACSCWHYDDPHRGSWWCMDSKDIVSFAVSPVPRIFCNAHSRIPVRIRLESPSSSTYGSVRAPLPQNCYPLSGRN